MNISHYPYRFVQRVEEPIISEESFLKYKLLYTFKSSKSHQWYWVWIEVYERDFYAVKFHLKSHRYSRDKYSIMTGLNEARPVIMSVLLLCRRLLMLILMHHLALLVLICRMKQYIIPNAFKYIAV